MRCARESAPLLRRKTCKCGSVSKFGSREPRFADSSICTPSGFWCFEPAGDRRNSWPNAAALSRCSSARIPSHLLAETTYTVNVTVYTMLVKETKVVLDNALTFMAYGHDTSGTA